MHQNVALNFIHRQRAAVAATVAAAGQMKYKNAFSENPGKWENEENVWQKEREVKREKRTHLCSICVQERGKKYDNQSLQTAKGRMDG